MLIDLQPLKKYRNYRFLYVGQFISTLGSMMTYVAVPYQIFKLTGSSLAVGVMGIVELAPLLVTALIGGVYADSMNRKNLLIFSEIGLAAGALLLAVNASLAHPHVWLIFLIAAVMSALNGFHSPALQALSPRLVHTEDLSAVSALTSIKGLVGTICGPALAGFLIGSFGISATFGLDFLSYVISIFAIWQIRIPAFKAEGAISPLKQMGEGFKYAWSRQELIGSYVVDFIAMIFGMPTALFPAISEHFGGVKVVGLLYAAPATGAMVAMFFSAWTKNIHRSGLAIALSALCWGIGITAFGFSSHLGLALFFLMVAGAGDAMSGVFRMTLWNQTIPDRLRGRLAGLEMISYMSGPLLGNAESGLVAAAFSTGFSVISGGIFCIAGVGLSVLFLPKFLSYRLPQAKSELI